MLGRFWGEHSEKGEPAILMLTTWSRSSGCSQRASWTFPVRQNRIPDITFKIWTWENHKHTYLLLMYIDITVYFISVICIISRKHSNNCFLYLKMLWLHEFFNKICRPRLHAYQVAVAAVEVCVGFSPAGKRKEEVPNSNFLQSHGLINDGTIKLYCWMIV